jgi:hypothetical protein
MATGIRTNFSMSFPREIMEAIVSYQEAAGLDSIQSAVRELVVNALAGNPADADRLAVRMRLEVQMKRFFLTTMSLHLEDTRRLLAKAIEGGALPEYPEVPTESTS